MHYLWQILFIVFVFYCKRTLVTFGTGRSCLQHKIFIFTNDFWAFFSLPSFKKLAQNIVTNQNIDVFSANQVFARLAPVTGYIFSPACRGLHILPRLAGAWRWLHVFPRLLLVTCFSACVTRFPALTASRSDWFGIPLCSYIFLQQHNRIMHAEKARERSRTLCSFIVRKEVQINVLH